MALPKIIFRILRYIQGRKIRTKLLFSFISIILLLSTLNFLFARQYISYNNDYELIIDNIAAINAISGNIKETIDYDLYQIIQGNKQFDQGKQITVVSAAFAAIERMNNNGNLSRDALFKLEMVSRTLQTVRERIEETRGLIGSKTIGELEAQLEKIRQDTSILNEKSSAFILQQLSDSEQIKKVINESIRQLIIINAAVFVFVVILSVLVAMYISGRISYSIGLLSQISRKLSQGDLTGDIQPKSFDEFAELISNFNETKKQLHSIMEKAMSAAMELSSSADELSATSQNLSEGAQSQAASVEQASSSIEEFSGSIENINNNAFTQTEFTRKTFQVVDKLTEDCGVVSGYASKALETARNSSEQARNGCDLMSHTIERMDFIDSSTKKISEMVRIISDISDKVNLLALNASIEAARAGEQGKGFAVVADEISKLAEQTAASAKSITLLVKDGLDEVGRGRQYVDSTSQALNQIISYISETESIVTNINTSSLDQKESSSKVLSNTHDVLKMSESISSATKEQMITSGEMSRMIEQINQTTQTTAMAAEEIYSSAERISAQAESLRDIIKFFKV